MDRENSMEKQVESQMEDILADIKEKNEQVSTLNMEINSLIKTLEEKMRILKTIQNSPQNFVSRLISTPAINPISTINPTQPNSPNFITLADRTKYPKTYTDAYERIVKYYDYKSNNTIVRNTKLMKYPRYICLTNADPLVVKNLLLHGFVDKIMTDETLMSISKLPSLLTESVQAMMKSYGPGGIYEIQVFDACSDLTGKPILLCQIFKQGRNSDIEFMKESLKMSTPCTLEQFQEWICNKRAIGISTLKSKLEDLIRGRKSCVIAYGQGGDVEDIITLYYNNDVLSTDVTNLSIMHSNIAGLKHKHATRTMELAKQMIAVQRNKSVISLSSPSPMTGKGRRKTIRSFRLNVKTMIIWPNK